MSTFQYTNVYLCSHLPDCFLGLLRSRLLTAWWTISKRAWQWLCPLNRLLGKWLKVKTPHALKAVKVTPCEMIKAFFFVKSSELQKVLGGLIYDDLFRVPLLGLLVKLVKFCDFVSGKVKTEQHEVLGKPAVILLRNSLKRATKALGEIGVLCLRENIYWGVPLVVGTGFESSLTLSRSAKIGTFLPGDMLKASIKAWGLPRCRILHV